MKISAGLMMYHFRDRELEVLLCHPGGPFWRDKDIWAIPKGKVEDGEDIFIAAKIEFCEETGLTLLNNEVYIPLNSVVQKSGKITHCWAFENNLDPLPECNSNFCSVEWPKGSGTILTIPEIDKMAWFNGTQVREKMREDQQELFNRLKEIIFGEKNKYIRVEDLFKNAFATTIVEDVRKQIQEENANKFIDKDK